MSKPAPYSRRTRAVCSLKDALAAFLQARGGEEHSRLTRLWEHWEMVMGAEQAALAVPLGHRKDVLLVAAEDSMAAQDIAMQAEDILERVNAFMNERYFSRIQVELVMGRKNLSHALSPLRPRPPDYRVPKPEKLGALSGAFADPESPVARCYEAYLRYFARTK
jgi:hypothetical protein